MGFLINTCIVLNLLLLEQMPSICRGAIIIVRTSDGVEPTKTHLGYFVRELRTLINGVLVCFFRYLYFVSDLLL